MNIDLQIGFLRQLDVEYLTMRLWTLIENDFQYEIGLPILTL